MTNHLFHSAHRSALIRLIHVARRDLAMPEDTYRALLESVAGKRSAADLDVVQLERVLERMKASGFRVRKSGGPAKGKPTVAEDKQALQAKIDRQVEALGVTSKYVDGIARKMFQVDSLRFCTPEQLRRIVAALTYHQKRQQQKPGAP